MRFADSTAGCMDMGDAAQMWSLRITQQVRHDTTGDAHGQSKRQRQRRLLAGGHVSCILQPVDCDQRGSKLPLALEVPPSIQPALGGTLAADFFRWDSAALSERRMAVGCDVVRAWTVTGSGLV